MAKIFISHRSGYSDYLFRSLQKALLKEGNEVLMINWMSRTKTMGEISYDNTYGVMTEKIKNFSPDIILNFNCSCPYPIIKALDCTVCITDADMPYYEQMTAGQKVMHKMLKWDNVHYLTMDSDAKDILDRYIGYEAAKERYHYWPVATSAYSEDLEFKRNIFFCGTNWYNFIYKFLGEKREDFEVLRWYEIFKTRYGAIDSFANDPANANDIKLLFSHFAGQERIRSLQMLIDLGLEIRGQLWDGLAFSNDPELAKLCINKKVIDEDIIHYYNSSKISVNFSHPQAINCFSFRVMDVMATNSCLLMEEKKDWHLLFGNYVSKDVSSAILYSDRFDMRQKAIRLLNDEELRKQCAKECNYAIEQNGRWEHRIKLLEEYLNIKLTNVGEPVEKEESFPFKLNNKNLKKIKTKDKYKNSKNKRKLILFFRKMNKLGLKSVFKLFYMKFGELLNVDIKMEMVKMAPKFFISREYREYLRMKKVRNKFKIINQKRIKHYKKKLEMEQLMKSEK